MSHLIEDEAESRLNMSLYAIVDLSWNLEKWT